MTILGIDPGKTTGWATIRIEDGRIRPGLVGTTTDMTLVEIQEHIQEADVVVYEGWRTRPDMAKAGKFNWQTVPAEQVVGSLKTLCKLFGKKALVEQQATQKVPGYGFAGMVYVPKKQGQHWQDALAHAVFYAVRKEGCSPIGA